MSRVVWTDDLRRDLAPRDASSLRPVDPKKAWASVRAGFSPSPSSDAFKKGLDHPGAARDAMLLAIETLGSKVLPPGATPEALGATLVVANQTARAEMLVLAIVETYGVAVATRALAAAHALSSARAYPKQWLVAMQASAPFGWRALRAGALRHGEAEVVNIARDAWPHAGLSLKTVLAHALSSAPDLAADVAREVGALPKGARVIVAPILASLRDTANLGAALAHRSGAHPLVDAVENLGLGALPAVLALWSAKVNDRVHLARATSCFDDDGAAAILAQELDKKSTRLIARGYFLRTSRQSALAEAAKGRSKLATLAAELLTQTTRADSTYETAALADLPTVLSAPPWIVGKPTRKLIVVAATAHARAETDYSTPERREAQRAQTGFEGLAEMDAEATAQYVAKVKTHESSFVWWVNHKRVPKVSLLELVTSVGYTWPGGQPTLVNVGFAVQAVAMFGQPAVRPLVDYLEHEWQAWPRIATFLANMELDRVVDSHRLAALLLDVVDDARFQSREWRYFEEHVDATLVGVIPVAVGKRGARRTTAERVLRRLARKHEAAVRVTATTYGDEVVASVDEILAFDARYECPKSAPKMPLAWKASTFTRPVLRDGRALPLEAVERIGHMLAFSTLESPYAGLADVRAACDPRALAELAWDAARAWEASGAKMSDAWMVESIAHLGDDAIMRRTTPAIAHAHIIKVLGHAATDAAATELCTIAWRKTHGKAKSHAYRRARERGALAAAFAVLARKRGLTVEQVEDTLAPTISITPTSALDVDTPMSSRLASLHTSHAHARVELDYGARTIHVGFDERLEPFVESAKGKLRDLPKAGKKDAPEKVARAQEVWRELQEDVAAIADVRLTSLERAMVTGRSWSIEAFRRAWIEHPLMRHLSRGVVWRTSSPTADGKATFRVAEDGTFADASDAPLSIGAASNNSISVAHPAEMTAEERDGWHRVFQDYRITQPLEQLSRPVLRGVSGDVLVLAPPTPEPFAEFNTKLTEAGFERGWRSREQTAARACVRGPFRLIGLLVIEDKKVARIRWSAEAGGQTIGLARVHPVDLSELATDLGLEPV